MALYRLELGEVYGVMKALPFHRRRVAFRVSLSSRPGIESFQAGIIEGHWLTMERAWFDGKPSWVRWYAVRVISGPSSCRGRVIGVAASEVFRWPRVGQSIDK